MAWSLVDWCRVQRLRVRPGVGMDVRSGSESTLSSRLRIPRVSGQGNDNCTSVYCVHMRRLPPPYFVRRHVQALCYEMRHTLCAMKSVKDFEWESYLL
ncbi:hypothetical protein AVEN_252181-1 [Araneus ventricosus]|uniref:Uncharacterized protein n=1 Tax=Araneus ventricosus TaxID=182803 RepID=A0A4Y2RM37_ARAVE|nr:hypothetical protein AVEN_252181-1 [Araneus ventricosus]